MAMKKVLLCPPTFYDIEYEINPWMHVENKVNQGKVKEEYEQLKQVYKDLHVEVLEISPAQGLPDMIYAANIGFPIGKSFIKANFRYPQRRKEAELAAAYFRKLGFEILTLPPNVFFEGQGDLLTVSGKYFFGWGKRSTKDGRDFISQMLGSKCMDFELLDPYFYHLDMSFAPLDSKTAVINPRSFTKEGLLRLKSEFPRIIETSKEDNKIIACNLLVIGKNVVIGKGISDQLRKDFDRYGFSVREVPTEEYRKGGGSVKCVTLEFF